MNGGWFWWGASSCTPAEYNALFIMNVKSLQKAGCDNVVWAWSPNLSDNKTIEAFMERYPGDDYVNLMGVDIYEFDDNDANYQTNLKETLDILVQAARQQGKLGTHRNWLPWHLKEERLVYHDSFPRIAVLSAELCPLLA